MARIPQQEIDRLKEEVSVQRLVETAGIALKKSGKDRAGLCPFHSDTDAEARGSQCATQHANRKGIGVKRASGSRLTFIHFRRTVRLRRNRKGIGTRSNKPTFRPNGRA